MSTAAAATQQESALGYFTNLLPELIKDVVQSTNTKLDDIPQVSVWLEKVLVNNCGTGKKNRGMATLSAYKILEDPSNINSESLRLAAVMGWCVELLQDFFLMLDDIMDNSEYRRGAPCWYRREGVGLSAINDALLIQGTLNTLLRKNFRNQPYYADVVDTFNETLFHTAMGQHLDWIYANQGDKTKLNSFTRERYDSIVKYKTALYTILLPVKLAMFMTGRRSAGAHAEAERLCIKIGNFFQMQDDYLDCFGKREVIGKDGTDIKEGKCNWCAVTALERCSGEQRVIMETYYGSKEPGHEQIIKDLYKELGVKEIYLEQELKDYESIRADIRRISPELPQELFVKLIDAIYMRKS